LNSQEPPDDGHRGKRNPEDDSRDFVADSAEFIDLDSLFNENISSSGSFDFRGHRETSLIKLLQALPICTLLIDGSHQIVFPNRVCRSLCADHCDISGASFVSVFPRSADGQKARDLLDNLFINGKPTVLEAILVMGGNRMWGRIHFRSVRISMGKYALALVQDLTFEKKQLLLNKKQEQLLRQAKGELEKRVLERTAELAMANERLKEEVFGRKRAQAAIQVVNEELEKRVEKRTNLLEISNRQLREEIEQRKLAEQNLQKSVETIEALFRATSDIVFLVDSRGAVLAINKPISGMNSPEISSKEILRVSGKTVSDLFPINTARKLREDISEVVATGKAIRHEERLGSKIFDCYLYPVQSKTTAVESVAVFCRDITGSKQAQEKLRLSAKIIESSNEGILVTDVEGNIVDVNEAFCSLTGYSREEVIGKNPRMMKSDRHGRDFYKEMWRSLKETGHWAGEVWDRRKNGAVFPKLLSISAVRNDTNQVAYYVGIFTDITNIKLTEQRLRHLAHFDPLTELPNRLLFHDRLHQALIEVERHKWMVALILLDLDRFKNINDTFGHQAGDALLDAVAKRLVTCVRKSDTVARLGGDEFTVILPEMPDPKAVARIARKITDVFTRPFHLGGREVFVTASMGITMYPNDGSQVERLLQNADMALYRAKEQGRNNFQFFSEDMNIEVVKRLELELALRGALERHEFAVYYQPRLDCATGSITGVEALVRWDHPTKGVVEPGDFILAAEETGLIVPIGEWVLRTSCLQKRLWQEAGLPSMTMAVNVSARQLSQTDLVDTAVRVISDNGLDPASIELELTESVAMKDADTTIKILREFKKNGIRVCIDDFGTGYSSLSYLKRFPIDKLKIDKSFIESCPTDPDDKAIVETVVAMAHSLKLRVVAEGVETQDQLNLLRAVDCDEWQGFHCSPPVPAENFVEILQKGWVER
jgi:diguanylate cyclase (GGDEF)-like protein/PAS domain S-box-containing protein